MCFRMFFILFSFALFPLSALATGMRIVVYHTSSRSIFLIGESHRVPNPNEGGNTACREKLKELLGEKDYIVLVEFRDMREGETMIFDDLTRICYDANEFPNSIMENVDTRRALAAATHVFGEPLDWMDFKKYYDGTYGDEELAKRYRRAVRRNFGCDLDTVTLGDVYKEVEEQIESLRKLRDSYWEVSCYWNWNSLYFALGHGICRVSRNLNDVKSIAVKYDIDESLPLAKAAERMWCIDNFYATDGPRKEIQSEILELGADIMDCFLFEKMIRYDRSSDSRPIVVIAGDAHIDGVEWFLRYVKTQRYQQYIDLRVREREVIPFKPDRLDMLKDTIEKLESLRVEEVKQSACVCQ